MNKNSQSNLTKHVGCSKGRDKMQRTEPKQRKGGSDKKKEFGWGVHWYGAG